MDSELAERLEQIQAATLLASKSIYTTAEACMYLGVKRSYLYQLAHDRRITYYKSLNGRMIYFRRDDIERWATAKVFPAKQ